MYSMLIVIIILIVSVIVNWRSPKQSKQNDSLRKHLEELDKLEYDKIKEELDHGRK